MRETKTTVGFLRKAKYLMAGSVMVVSAIMPIANASAAAPEDACTASNSTELIQAATDAACTSVLITGTSNGGQGIQLFADFDGNGKSYYVATGNYGLKIDDTYCTGDSSVCTSPYSPSDILISNATLIGETGSKGLINLYAAGNVAMSGVTLDATNSWYVVAAKTVDEVSFDGTATGTLFIDYGPATSPDHVLTLDIADTATVSTAYDVAFSAVSSKLKIEDGTGQIDTLVHDGQVLTPEDSIAAGLVVDTAVPEITGITIDGQSIDLGGTSVIRLTGEQHEIALTASDPSGIKSYFMQFQGVRATNQNLTFNGLLADGQYSVTVAARDNADNRLNDTNVTFTVDNTAPTVRVNGEAASDTVFNGTNTQIYVEATDANQINLTVLDSDQNPVVQKTGNGYIDENLVGLPDGDYTVEVADIAGNVTSFNFTKDFTPAAVVSASWDFADDKSSASLTLTFDEAVTLNDAGWTQSDAEGLVWTKSFNENTEYGVSFADIAGNEDVWHLALFGIVTQPDQEQPSDNGDAENNKPEPIIKLPHTGLLQIPVDEASNTSLGLNTTLCTLIVGASFIVRRFARVTRK